MDFIKDTSIRKKLILSNVLMIVIPIVFAMAFGGITLKVFGDDYFDSVEDIVKESHGMYTVQNSMDQWKSKTDFSDSSIQKLNGELNQIHYHLMVLEDGKVIWNSLSDGEQTHMDTYTKQFKNTKHFSFQDNEHSIIKNQFAKNQHVYTLFAVYTGEIDEQDSYIGLKKFIIYFMASFIVFMLLIIVGTNYVLSRLIAKSILRPLAILKNGTKEIANGNLDFDLDYQNKDEFYQVCQSFDTMREHLKESVNTQLAYEAYRKELLAGISHDLRTPLTSIKGYTEGLRDGIANTEEKKQRYYQVILTRAKDMEALVDSLSTFAKLENQHYKYKFERVNMDAFLSRLVDEYQQERVHISYQNEVKEAMVNMDVQEMHRVFINLFENSIKYNTEKDTTIDVSVTKREDRLVVVVKDNGPGVDLKDLPHIFQTFYRADSARTHPEGGSGLGLAIVKQIVEGHHGSIRAYNENGLAMEMVLPMVED